MWAARPSGEVNYTSGRRFDRMPSSWSELISEIFGGNFGDAEILAPGQGRMRSSPLRRGAPKLPPKISEISSAPRGLGAHNAPRCVCLHLRLCSPPSPLRVGIGSSRLGEARAPSPCDSDAPERLGRRSGRVYTASRSSSAGPHKHAHARSAISAISAPFGLERSDSDVAVEPTQGPPGHHLRASSTRTDDSDGRSRATRTPPQAAAGGRRPAREPLPTQGVTRRGA